MEMGTLLQRDSSSVFCLTLWRCIPVCLLISLLGWFILDALTASPDPVSYLTSGITRKNEFLLLILGHSMLISVISCWLYSRRLKQYDNQISQQAGTLEPPVELSQTLALLARTQQQLGMAQAEKTLLIEQMKAAQPLLQSGRQCAALLHDVSSPAQFIGDNLAFLHDSHQQLAPLLQTLSQLEPDSLPPALGRQLQNLELSYLQQELPHAIRQSRAGIQQISQLTNGACCWLHPDKQHCQSADIARITQQASTLTRRQWSSVATLTIAASPTLPRLTLNLSRLLQVLINLMTNAADAIRQAQRKNGKIEVTLTTDQRWLKIRVSDNGTGIPASVARRLFEPFVTSKLPGEGTGLGLAICKDIIEQEQGGRLTYETIRGEGATFIIELPL